MKYLSIILFSLLLFSCIEKKTLPLKNKENAIISGNNKGIYFPKYYLEALLETRSHILASNKFYELPNNNSNNVIIIFENEIMYTYNFHEGVSRRIINYNDNEIIVEDPYNEGHRIYIMDNFSIINGNDIIYISVSEELDNWYSNRNSYITNIMFGDKVFINETGDKIFRMDNGNISYKNIEYTIGLDTVLLSTEYDYLYNREYKNIYFRIENDIINIYELNIPEELLGDPMQYKLGTYYLIDKYR